MRKSLLTGSLVFVLAFVIGLAVVPQLVTPALAGGCGLCYDELCVEHRGDGCDYLFTKSCSGSAVICCGTLIQVCCDPC